MKKSIVILIGAGISKESGIKTFRGCGRLWENHRIEEVASTEGFKKNLSLLYYFCNQRRKDLLSSEVQPNQAHLALKTLQDLYNKDKTNISNHFDKHYIGKASEQVEILVQDILERTII